MSINARMDWFRRQPEPRPRQNRRGKKRKAGPGRGWIAVNFSTWETEELRAVAECAGIQFRILASQALRREMWRLEKEIGLPGLEAVKLSAKERRSMGKRWRYARERISFLAPRLVGSN